MLDSRGGGRHAIGMWLTAAAAAGGNAGLGSGLGMARADFYPADVCGRGAREKSPDLQLVRQAEAAPARDKPAAAAPSSPSSSSENLSFRVMPRQANGRSVAPFCRQPPRPDPQVVILPAYMYHASRVIRTTILAMEGRKNANGDPRSGLVKSRTHPGQISISANAHGESFMIHVQLANLSTDAFASTKESQAASWSTRTPEGITRSLQLNIRVAPSDCGVDNSSWASVSRSKDGVVTFW
ncbi:hypothetical protein ON010_g7326 [Phytophthora cinnamomi]|nr:hypothetical protein ON010_g7326 [Phytophthora cinnamomi]